MRATEEGLDDVSLAGPGCRVRLSRVYGTLRLVRLIGGDGAARVRSEFIFPGGRCDLGSLLEESPELEGATLRGLVGRWSTWPWGTDGTAAKWAESQHLHGLWLPRGHALRITKAVSAALVPLERETERLAIPESPIPPWLAATSGITAIAVFVVPIGFTLQFEVNCLYDRSLDTPLRHFLRNCSARPTEALVEYIDTFVVRFYLVGIPDLLRLLITFEQADSGRPIIGPVEFFKTVVLAVIGVAALGFITLASIAFLQSLVAWVLNITGAITARRSVLDDVRANFALMAKGAITGDPQTSSLGALHSPPSPDSEASAGES